MTPLSFTSSLLRRTSPVLHVARLLLARSPEAPFLRSSSPATPLLQQLRNTADGSLVWFSLQASQLPFTLSVFSFQKLDRSKWKVAQWRKGGSRQARLAMVFSYVARILQKLGSILRIRVSDTDTAQIRIGYATWRIRLF